MKNLIETLAELILVGNLTIPKHGKIDIYELIKEAEGKGVISKECFEIIVKDIEKQLDQNKK
jgi:hypothetical protein